MFYRTGPLKMLDLRVGDDRRKPDFVFLCFTPSFGNSSSLVADNQLSQDIAPGLLWHVQ